MVEPSASSAGGFRSEEEYIDEPAGVKGNGDNIEEPAGVGGNERLLLTSAGSRDESGGSAESEQEDCVVSWEHRNGNGMDARTNDFTNFNLLDKSLDRVKEAALSISGSDRLKDDYRKSLERCILACTKGFIIGSGLRGGLALVSVLSRLKRRKPSLSTKSDAEAIRVAVKETLRYGLFVGTFAGSFCTVDAAIVALGGGRRTARWRALVAGAVAGPSLLLTGPEMRHTSMAIYIFLRASVLAARCGIKSKRIGPIARPLTWKHGDTFLMCLSGCQILYAWIMNPKSLPSSYISFLNKHGCKDSSVLQGIRALALQKDIPAKLLAVKEHYHSRGISVDLTPDIKIPCQIIHGGQGCEEHFVSFLKNGYFGALPVYLPVYLVPALLVHRQGLFARPLSLLSKTLLGTARSSLFLSAYCASAWLTTCWTFRILGYCNPALVAIGSFPAGLAVLLEKKSRRMELALYCLSRAIESFGICVSDSGVLKKQERRIPDRVDVVLFSLATSVIMHCYAEERDVFRSKYLNVLDWVFGIPDPAKSASPPEAKSNDVSVDEKSQQNGTQEEVLGLSPHST